MVKIRHAQIIQLDAASEDQKFRAAIHQFMAKWGESPDYQKRLHKLLAQAPQTDIGNALRMYARYGLNIRYVTDWGVWLFWTGQLWKRDETNMIGTLAADMAGYLIEEAKTLRPQPMTAAQLQGLKESQLQERIRKDVEAGKLQQWARQTGRHRELLSAIAELQIIRGVSITSQDLDTNHSLLNCPNGTLNLNTLRLQKHDRDDLITKITGVEYTPQAQAPDWEIFMQKISSNDRETARFLQQVTGMGLTGRRYDAILPICYGAGGNGKSVFVEIIKEVLGTYGATANTDLFLERPAGGVSNDIARLVGCRFLTASETREGAPLNEALVKALTGGDKQTARFLHKEFFEFSPVFTPILLTNHKPTIRGQDTGIWRRIKLIPWLHDFTQDPDRKDFEDVLTMLRGQGSGILTWAVRGLMDREKNGLAVSKAVKIATEAYKSESDLIGDFIQECLIQDPLAKITKSRTYELYKAHMSATGHNALADNKLSTKFTERNIQSGKSNGVRFWLGIRERSTDDVIEDETPPDIAGEIREVI